MLHVDGRVNKVQQEICQVLLFLSAFAGGFPSLNDGAHDQSGVSGPVITQKTRHRQLSSSHSPSLDQNIRTTLIWYQ